MAPAGKFTRWSSCGEENPAPSRRRIIGCPSQVRARDHRTVTILIFLCTLVSFYERVGFSIAITNIAEEHGTTQTAKGLALSSYFIGFTASQIPGGYLVRLLGGKKTLALSFLVWSPLSAALGASTGAGYSTAVVLGCRLGIGLAQGIFLPAAHSVLGHWTPRRRRGRHFALAMSGMFAGAALAMVTVPSVCRHSAHITFYISAIMGTVWLVVWLYTGSDAPTAAEREASGFEEATVQGWETGTRDPSDTRAKLESKAGTPEQGEWGSSGMARELVDWACCQPTSAVLESPVSPAARTITNPGLVRGCDREVLTAVGKGCCVAPSRSSVFAGGVTVGCEKKEVRVRLDSGEHGHTTDGSFDFPHTLPGGGGDGGGAVVVDQSGAVAVVKNKSNRGDQGSNKNFGSVRKYREESRGAVLSTLSPTTSNESPSPLAHPAIETVNTNSPEFEASPATEDLSPPRKRELDTRSGGVILGANERRTLRSCGKGFGGFGSQVVEAKHASFPWKAMAMSSAAWAVVAGNVGAGMAINVVMSWLPTYYEDFVQLDLEHLDTGTLISPYLTMMAFSILGGVAYGWLTNARGMTKALASKIITGIAFGLALGVFLCMGLATSTFSATLLSSLALAGAAMSRGGWSTKHMEIAAPEHAAMLYSVANSISAAASIVGVSVTGKILDSCGGGSAPEAWTAAMGVVGMMSGACGTFFVTYAKGDEVLFPAVAATAPDVASGREKGERRDRPRSTDRVLDHV